MRKIIFTMLLLLILCDIPVWCSTENPFQPPKPAELIFSDLSILSKDITPTISELQVEENLIVQEEQNLQKEQTKTNNLITALFILVALSLGTVLLIILRGAQ